jgi:hypothetical protein
MIKYIAPVIITVALAIQAMPGNAAGLKQISVYVARPGVYQIVDPNDNSVVYVSDPAAYIRYKYQPLTGFGGKISYGQFQQGGSAVDSTLNAASSTVNTAAAATYNVVNQAPSWRKLTVPITSFLRRVAAAR